MNALLRSKPLVLVPKKYMNLSAKNYKGSYSKSKGDMNFFEADSSNAINKLYHPLSFGLMLVTPIAIMFSPSKVNTGLDYVLGLAIPVHAHVGLNYVISDYVPKAYRFAARSGLLGVTCLTIAGMLKLNFDGPGLTQTLKALWKPKKE